MKKRVKRLTKKQRDAAYFLDLSSIVHFLLTEQRVPIIKDGKLWYVACQGVSKEAFKQAIEKRVMRNIYEAIQLGGRSLAQAHE